MGSPAFCRKPGWQDFHDFMKKWFEERHAPAPGTPLCSTEDIAAGEVREFRFGEKTNFVFRMLVHNHDGEFTAFKNACPHFDVPLNHTPEQLFTPDGQHFLCMTHYAKFNKVTGFCVEGPYEGEYMDIIPLTCHGKILAIGEPDS